MSAPYNALYDRPRKSPCYRYFSSTAISLNLRTNPECKVGAGGEGGGVAEREGDARSFVLSPQVRTRTNLRARGSVSERWETLVALLYRGRPRGQILGEFGKVRYGGVMTGRRLLLFSCHGRPRGQILGVRNHCDWNKKTSKFFDGCYHKLNTQINIREIKIPAVVANLDVQEMR